MLTKCLATISLDYFTVGPTFVISSCVVPSKKLYYFSVIFIFLFVSSSCVLLNFQGTWVTRYHQALSGQQTETADSKRSRSLVSIVFKPQQFFEFLALDSSECQ